MPPWISENQTLFVWIGAVSIALFVATLVIAPVMITRIPPDYFTHEHRPPGLWAKRPPAWRLSLKIFRAVLGGFFILAGVAMLILPGQGVLAILIGFLLVDFPGKYRLEQRLIARPRVLRVINAFRGRRNRPPLQPPEPAH